MERYIKLRDAFAEIDKMDDYYRELHNEAEASRRNALKSDDTNSYMYARGEIVMADSVPSELYFLKESLNSKARYSDTEKKLANLRAFIVARMNSEQAEESNHSNSFCYADILEQFDILFDESGE